MKNLVDIIMVFCRSKDEFIKLQKYLVKEYYYLWDDFNVSFLPYPYDYKNGIILNIDKVNYRLTFSKPVNSRWDYTFKEFIQSEKKDHTDSGVEKFIDRAFEDIVK